MEFSLIALLLFALLFGILQFGLAYNRVQGLHAAAREGARLASLGADVDDDVVLERVKDAAPAFIARTDLNASTVSVFVTGEPENADWCRGDNHNVTVKVDLTALSEADFDKYEGDIPGIGRLSPALVTEASFLCEQERS